jgi:hypothetical protein
VVLKSYALTNNDEVGQYGPRHIEAVKEITSCMYVTLDATHYKRVSVSSCGAVKAKSPHA